MDLWLAVIQMRPVFVKKFFWFWVRLQILYRGVYKGSLLCPFEESGQVYNQLVGYSWQQTTIFKYDWKFMNCMRNQNILISSDITSSDLLVIPHPGNNALDTRFPPTPIYQRGFKSFLLATVSLTNKHIYPDLRYTDNKINVKVKNLPLPWSFSDYILVCRINNRTKVLIFVTI